MTYKNVLEAEKEAKRFLEKMREFKSRRKEDGETSKYIYGTKESGALKRASMDLTRSLAKMRQS